MRRCIAAFLPALLLVGIYSFETKAEPQKSGASAPSAESIVKALRGRTRRGAVDPAVAAAERATIEKFKQRSRRGAFNLRDREEIFAFSESKPQLALTIYFPLDSAEITGDAVSAVDALAAALSSPEFRGRTFNLGGHTDARGGAEYNLDLSRRRAEAVKAYLVETKGLNADQLIAVGFGAEKLKNPLDPTSQVNRRVQIVNLGE